MSLLRKTLWPTAIALGFLVFLGAIGQGNVVKTASADTGEICKIATTATVIDKEFYMTVDQTILVVAIVEVEDFDEDLSVYDASVDLDDGGDNGDSDITSRAVEDGDVWEYDDSINTDFLNEVGIVDPSEQSSNFDVGDLEDSLDAAFDGWNKALGASIGLTSIAIGDNICGDSNARIASDLLLAIEEEIGECIDDDDCDNDWTEADLISDLTWPLEVGIDPGDIAKWLADWIIANPDFNETVDDDPCEEISGDLQDYLILKGVSPGIAEDIGDDVEDLCNGNMSDGDYSYTYWPEDFSFGMDGWVIVDVTCVTAGTFEVSFSIHGENEDSENIQIHCVGEVDDFTLTAYPNKVEIVPAMGSVSYSLIIADLLDEDGAFPLASAVNVDFRTNKCVFLDEDGVKAADFAAIAKLFDAYSVNNAASAAAINAYLNAIAKDPDDDSNKVAGFNLPDGTSNLYIDLLRSVDDGDGIAVIILDCTGANIVPGVATITAEIDQEGQDIVKSTTVTVVGPPAGPVVATADQTSVVCGDRVQLTVSVKDSAGQAVSDHTLVEVVTTFGGVLGGTGAVAGNLGFVVPVSSTLTETFNGVATFFLLTSQTHVGPYDVTVSTGGGGSVTQALGGFFSTPVQVGRATVSCTLPAAPVAPAVTATVTAPRTGGGIVPPNTGDAGLAASSESGLSLLVIAGVVAFALAGVASLKFARR